MTEKEKTLARDADKYVVRFPDGMRSEVERLAKEAGISMNTAIVEAIELHLVVQERKDLLLDALQERIPQVPITEATDSEGTDEDRDYLDGLPKSSD